MVAQRSFLDEVGLGVVTSPISSGKTVPIWDTPIAIKSWSN